MWWVGRAGVSLNDCSIHVTYTCVFTFHVFCPNFLICLLKRKIFPRKMLSKGIKRKQCQKGKESKRKIIKGIQIITGKHYQKGKLTCWAWFVEVENPAQACSVLGPKRSGWAGWPGREAMNPLSPYLITQLMWWIWDFESVESTSSKLWTVAHLSEESA